MTLEPYPIWSFRIETLHAARMRRLRRIAAIMGTHSTALAAGLVIAGQMAGGR